MPETDRAFYTRRIQEEVRQALISDTPELEDLHLGWAKLYQQRLTPAASRLAKLESA